MGTVLILSGLPASGKSTYAEEILKNPIFHWRCISWDALRAEIPNYKFSKEQETQIVEKSIDLFEHYAAIGLNIIIDNTNLNDRSIARWTRLAGEYDMSVQFKNFPTPLEECVRRDALRTGRAKVGRIVIERMALANGLIQWSDTPIVFTDQENRVHTVQRNIVIVDVDGTLADNKHRILHKTVVCKSCKNGRVREWNEWDGVVGDFICQTCHGTGSVQGTVDWDHYYQEHLILSDETKPVIVDWVRELYKTHTVVILSGRPENRAGKATEEWLRINDIPYHYFFMRGSGDMRDDVLVKKDILDKMPKNKIAFAIDDRNRIVDQWRALGLTCYQVVSREEGDF